MQKKLLIDASHQEETRIVLLNNQQVEEFDFESINKKQIAGNIFLAKVTRVEPSLQAAFLDYGGNRHGFLAFSEIHPDYYQIPVADKKLLLEDTFNLEDENNNIEVEFSNDDLDNLNSYENQMFSSKDLSQIQKIFSFDNNEDTYQSLSFFSDKKEEKIIVEPKELENLSSNLNYNYQSIKTKPISLAQDTSNVTRLTKQKKTFIKNKYKIQEVIKVRQVLLIQVVKDERGNKGAALTTYISLAGRYCVLMPNTARGGGISRKITNIGDRKKLKETAKEFSIPDKMGLIIRTAGAKKTKSEIKKDYEYLLRQWEQIRNLTLKSIAPCPIYEEGSVIKRTIRDLYSKDISEIIVEGDTGYNEAKEYMKMLMPTHSKKIKKYNDKIPIFSFFSVEEYLAGMFNPTVQLKSGGYIVIGITEALVAIDVNSGKATKESGIEETALRTNIEAADEIARQLRMRDLAGLIVIDFIDMEERKNNSLVEKRIRDSLKIDRARIQVGKISSFGLLEMSRQRLRYGMIEATTMLCSNCHGTGLTRSNENLSLSILRKLENIHLEKNIKGINVKVPVDVANYILNQKRTYLSEIEKGINGNIFIISDLTLNNPNYVIEYNKNLLNSNEISSLSNVITIDSSNKNNNKEELKKTTIQDNNNLQINESSKETKFKNSKRRRRKNNKFRKYDFNNDDQSINKNSEITNNSKTEKINVEANEFNNNSKTINNEPKNKNKKIKLEETKNNNAKIQYANKTIENLLTPDNELNNSNTNKTTRKRVVKKVKEVFNNKNEIIKEKSTDKKDTSETKTSKSGWWKRKI
tara:strand:+ start:570 stop:2993 length:2424 start_codon:yes stop_codon:yes gene_type:complete